LIHTIQFPGLGELEAVPNGDAVFYTDLLGITASIREAGRYALRWPGWCAFWRPLKRLGFLSDEALRGLNAPVSPHQFMVKLLEPQLQYGDDEKDLVAMYNIFSGIKDGRPKSIKTSLLIERDLPSGLFGMSLGVGTPASIVAQMIVSGEIKKKGVLNPMLDVPYDSFMAELEKRGIFIKEEVIA
jgi:saccharopine dehydrogenase-like NADP-dependent oxidoreductase